MKIVERVLLAGALFEFVHLTFLFERRAEVDGLTLAIFFTIGMPLLWSDWRWRLLVATA